MRTHHTYHEDMSTPGSGNVTGGGTTGCVGCIGYPLFFVFEKPALCSHLLSSIVFLVENLEDRLGRFAIGSKTVYKSYPPSPLSCLLMIVFPPKMSSKKSMGKINFGQKSKQVSKLVNKKSENSLLDTVYKIPREERKIVFSAAQVHSSCEEGVRVLRRRPWICLRPPWLCRRWCWSTPW